MAWSGVCTRDLAKPLTIAAGPGKHRMDAPPPHDIAGRDGKFKGEICDRYFAQARLPDERLGLLQRMKLTRPPLTIADGAIKARQRRLSGFGEQQAPLGERLRGRLVGDRALADLSLGLGAIILEQYAIGK